MSALIALGVAAIVAAALAQIAGLREVGHAFAHLHRMWIWCAIAAQALSVFDYVLVYRAVVREIGDRRLAAITALDLVLTGFGPLSPAGGFASDERSLARLGIDPDRARRVVLVLGGVELLALVWVACAAAIVAVAVDHSLGAALTWPWIAGVPIGTVAAVAVARDDRLVPRRARVVVPVVREVLGLARHPRRLGIGWLGIVVYWLADMAALAFALRACGLHPPSEAIVLAYATGYIVSRRTLPLGGAGLIELLMTLSLTWVHEPLADALAGVVLYRVIDLGIATLRGMLARRRLAPQMTAS